VKLPGKLTPAFVAAVLLSLLTAGLGYLLLESITLGRPLVHASYDMSLVLQGARPVNEAVIVYLDEVSHTKLNQPLNAPWDRKLHAQLIDRLTSAGAKVIAFDIVFTEPSIAGAEADEVLAKALRDSGRVVLAADRIPIGHGQSQTIPPIEILLTNAASVGSAEMIPEPDIKVRRHTPHEELPSLSWATAEFVDAQATKNEAVASSVRWINYYGEPGIVPSVSYADALDASVVSNDFFRGKAVFVGAKIITKFANDRKDEYPNPFAFFKSRPEIERQGKVFVTGVEIQATVYANLVRGDWLGRWPARWETTLLVMIGLVVGFGFMRLQPAAALGAAVGVLLLLLGICYLAMKNLSWFVFFVAVLQIGFALVISVTYNSLQAYVQKRLAEQTLALYLSPKLVKKFSAGGNPELLKPGARKQEVTLFFSDVADFTKQSEGLDSDELAHVMNEYFEVAVSRGIHKTDGTVVKYIGDAVFAFWNAPDLQADHALRACQAMLHFRDNVPLDIRGLKLHTRIGLHTGVANVGNFGSVERVDYTALGENVNLASRLEGLNKYLGTTYLLSGATLAGVGNQLVTRELGRFKLKGFEAAVAVHELVGWLDEAESTRPWRDTFQTALVSYKRGDLAAAREGFEAVLRLKPEDGPARFYLERIAEHDDQPSPTGWTGEIQLKEK